VKPDGTFQSADACLDIYPGLNFSEADLFYLRAKLDFFRWHYKKYRQTMVKHWAMSQYTPYSDRVGLEKLGPIFSDSAKIFLGIVQDVNQANSSQSSDLPLANTVNALIANTNDKLAWKNLAEQGLGQVTGFFLEDAGLAGPLKWLVDIPLESANILGTVTLTGLNQMMDNFYRGFAELLLNSAWNDAWGNEIYEYGTRDGLTGQLLNALDDVILLIDNGFGYETSRSEENWQNLQLLIGGLKRQADLTATLSCKIDTFCTRINTYPTVHYKVSQALNQVGLDPSEWVDEINNDLASAMLLAWKAEAVGLKGIAGMHRAFLNNYTAEPHVSGLYFLSSDTPGVDHFPVSALIDHTLHPHPVTLPQEPDITVGPDSVYTTIQAGVNAAKAGDAIKILPGVYNESVIIDKPGVMLYFAGSNLNDILIGKSESDADASILPFAIKVTADHVTIHNLRIISTVRGIVLEGAHDCVIANNFIQFNLRGIVLNDSHNNTIAGNNIYNSRDTCIRIASGGGNIIYNNNFVTDPSAFDAVNAYDGGENHWDNGSTGNFWQYYTRPADPDDSPVPVIATGAYTITGGQEMDARVYGGVPLSSEDGDPLKAVALVEGLFGAVEDLYVNFYFGNPDSGGIKINAQPVLVRGYGNFGVSIFDWNISDYFGAQDIYAMMTTDGSPQADIKVKVNIKPADSYTGTEQQVRQIWATGLTLESQEQITLKYTTVNWVASPYTEGGHYGTHACIRIDKEAGFHMENTTFGSPATLYLGSALLDSNYNPGAAQIIDLSSGRLTLTNWGRIDLHSIQDDGTIDLSGMDLTIDHAGDYIYLENISCGTLKITNTACPGGRAIKRCRLTGLRIENSEHLDIIANIINGGSPDGIDINESSNLLIRDNTISGCYRGVDALDCDHVEIINNTVSNCNYGFHINRVASGTVLQNVLSENEVGIGLYNCSDLDIKGNTINGSAEHGILVSGDHGIEISSNTLDGNLYAITVGSNSNTVFDNTIRNSAEYGLKIENAENNTIFNNNFIDNFVNAEDFGTGNTWYKPMPIGGNYWTQTGGSFSADLYPYTAENGWRIDDGTGPAISELEISRITGKSAVVTWHTDEWAESGVIFGPDQTIMENNSFMVDHSFVLSGLDDGTDYVVTVYSLDRFGNRTEGQTQFSTPDITPPKITSMRITGIDFHTAALRWSASEPVNISVEYGYGADLLDSTTLTTNNPAVSGTVNLPNLTDGSNYCLWLTVTDVSGNQTESQQPVCFTTLSLPDAIIAPHPAGVFFGTEIFFDAGLSGDTDGDIVSCTWDFGDGHTSNRPRVTHTFQSPGTYTITLWVTDSDGGTDSASTQVRMGRRIIVNPDIEIDQNNHIWHTITDAVNDSAAMDTIEVAGGQYNENIILDKPVYLKGNNFPVINGQGINRTSTILVTADNCRIEGFVITGGGQDFSTGDSAVRIASSGNIIKGNRIENNTYSNGIFLDSQASQNLITDNTITDNAKGINCDLNEPVYGNIIRRNEILSNGSGVSIHGNMNIIEKNRFQDNGEAVWVTGRQAEVASNIIIFNAGRGIRLYACENSRITENYVMGNQVGLDIQSTSKDCLILDNSFFDNSVNVQTDSIFTQKWDDEYGGNYWGDYTGNDSDHDGIGDTPYQIRGNTPDTDNKPLMAPGKIFPPLPPVVVDILATPASGYAGDGLTLTVNAVDLNNDTLQYLWRFKEGCMISGKPEGLDMDTLTGYKLPPFDADNPACNTKLFEVTVTNTHGLSVTRTVSVTVNNSLPAIDAVVDPATGGVGTKVVLTLAASDKDWGPVACEWEQVGGTPVTLSSPYHYQIDPPYNRRVTCCFEAPPFDAFNISDNTLKFEVTSTDEAGVVSTATVSFIVANTPPVNCTPFSIPQISVQEDTPGTYRLSVSDPDGGEVEYSITTPPAHGIAVVDAEGLVTYTPDADYSGTDSMVVTITDEGGASTPVELRDIYIKPANDAPA